MITFQGIDHKARGREFKSRHPDWVSEDHKKDLHTICTQILFFGTIFKNFIELQLVKKPFKKTPTKKM